MALIAKMRELEKIKIKQPQVETQTRVIEEHRVIDTAQVTDSARVEISDPATLDSLARKLKPIFADLERRGL